MIEPFKYLMQPVALERDDDTGRIVKEVPGEPIAVFSAAQASEAVVEFEKKIAEMQESSPSMNGSEAPTQVILPG